MDADEADAGRSDLGPRRGPAHELATAHANGSDPSLIDLIEWLFFAYRDFTNEADSLLATRGFGRAHHRVLHFVNRRPGLRVADLLEILNITKQSLARVLKQLVDDGYVVQHPGETDRRERHLYVTPAGAELAKTLEVMQEQRLAGALSAAGPRAHETVEAFLRALVDRDRQGDVAALIAAGRSVRSDADETHAPGATGGVVQGGEGDLSKPRQA